METNPTTQEVDDFILRQEEVERLRSSTAESLVRFYSWKEKAEEILRHDWNMWNDIDRTTRESLEE